MPDKDTWIALWWIIGVPCCCVFVMFVLYCIWATLRWWSYLRGWEDGKAGLPPDESRA